MLTQLRAGEHFGELIERADPAGQDRKCIGRREHARLAVVHAVGDDDLGSNLQRRFQVAQEARNDAEHLAAALGDGKGDFAHQTDAAAAEDEVETLPRHGGAELARGLGEDGIGAVGGAAEDANGLPVYRRFSCHFVHDLIFSMVSCPNYGGGGILRGIAVGSLYP